MPRRRSTTGGDAQAQVPTAFLISSTTRTTTSTPAATPAMRPGCYKTPADDRRSCLRHAHANNSSADTNQHPERPHVVRQGGGPVRVPERAAPPGAPPAPSTRPRSPAPLTSFSPLPSKHLGKPANGSPGRELQLSTSHNPRTWGAAAGCSKSNDGPWV
jgi:hypothetical protein